MRDTRATALLGSPLTYLSGLLVATVILFSLFVPGFAVVENYWGIAAAAAALGTMAIGTTLALAAGSVDFSIAGNAALSAMVGAYVASVSSPELGIVAAIGTCLLVGLVNAAIVVRLHINPFIATLAVAGSARGLALVLAGSSGIFVEEGLVVAIGQGRTWGIPNSVLVLAIVSIVCFVLMRFTTFGRALLAVGGGLGSARLAGLRTDRIRLAGYLLSAATAGIAGFILTGRAGVALPLAANGSELLVFSAVLLGGTSLAGGRASVVGSLVGILLLNTVYTGLVLAKVAPYWQTVIQGILLIIAVWLAERQLRGRPTGPLDAGLLKRSDSAPSLQ